MIANHDDRRPGGIRASLDRGQQPLHLRVHIRDLTVVGIAAGALPRIVRWRIRRVRVVEVHPQQPRRIGADPIELR